MFGFISRDDLEGIVHDAVEEAVRQARSEEAKDGGTVTKLADRVTALKAKIETLTIEKDRREEEFARREREIEHKVGLERQRQEFEIEQAKREAAVEIREANLQADRERFEEQMEFHRERLEGEVESLRKLTESLLARLPDAKIIANFGASGDGR